MIVNTELKAAIDLQITNETVDFEISPEEVGGRMKEIVDYVDQQTVTKVIKRTLTHSELLNLAATPILLLEATANKLYIPSRVVLKYNDNNGWGYGGGDFTIKLKNDANSNTLTSFGSDLGGGTIKEQLRFISFVTQTATDSFFNRRVEFSITASPTVPMINTTTMTVYLFYNEITL